VILPQAVVQHDDTQRIQELRLYSWMRFTWQSKMLSGSTVCPVVERSSRELYLRLTLGPPEGLTEGAIVCERRELPELAEGRSPSRLRWPP